MNPFNYHTDRFMEKPVRIKAEKELLKKQKEKLLKVYDECRVLGATKEHLAPLSAFIWISNNGKRDTKCFVCNKKCVNGILVKKFNGVIDISVYVHFNCRENYIVKDYS